MIKVAWSPVYCHSLPEGHRFPMAKYQLIPEQLIREGSMAENQLFQPKPLDDNIALLTHQADYLNHLKSLTLDKKIERRIGFPLSSALVEREWIITRGTIDCAHFALQYGAALNVAGGTHHAFADKGEGFCLLNDIAVSANYLLDNGLCKKILVVDLDVHQGNGTAALFPNAESVFTFSMHGQNNYPLLKEKSALDIGLPDGIEDEAYLKMLENHLPRLFQHVQPDLVFYQAGVDILDSDRLGRLKVSQKGVSRRDEMVLHACHENKVPVVVVMGGGYSHRLYDLVETHCNTFRLAFEIFG